MLPHRLVRAGLLLSQLLGPLFVLACYGPSVTANRRLWFLAAFDQLLIAVVAGLAQGLERTIPELVLVAFVRLNVIADSGRNDARQAHSANRILAELL